MCTEVWIAPHVCPPVCNLYSHDATHVDCATPLAICVSTGLGLPHVWPHMWPHLWIAPQVCPHLWIIPMT